jgi:hypothetical protein
MDLSAFVSVTSLLLWAAAFLYFRSYLKRRTGADRLLAEFREEVEKLVSEIDAATDRDATLVEERVRSLRALLEDADRRISAYTREIDRRGSEERAYAELGRRARPFRGTDAENAPPSPAPAPVRAEPPLERPQEQRVASPVERSSEQSPEPRFVRAEVPIEPKPAPFAERVAELYRAGFSADLIAKRLGATVAEVDLAIALTGRAE